MTALIDHNLHILSHNNGNENTASRSYGWLGPNGSVKETQVIIRNSALSASKEQLQELISALYKSIVKSTMEGQNHIANANIVVSDWNIGVKQSFDASKVRRAFLMFLFKDVRGNIDNLTNWQLDLIQAFIGKPQTEKVCIFQSSGINHFWVVVADTSTSSLLDYSNGYIDILKKYKTINCDFMIFDIDEVEDGLIPNESVILDMRG